MRRAFFWLVFFSVLNPSCRRSFASEKPELSPLPSEMPSESSPAANIDAPPTSQANVDCTPLLTSHETDMATALQSCIDATLTGGTLLLPQGTFMIGKQVLIKRPITIKTKGDVTQTCSLESTVPDEQRCVKLTAMPNFADKGGILKITSNNTHLDRIIVDGNKAARAGTARSRCQAGQGDDNNYGFNIWFECNEGCSFRRGISMNALCGTALLFAGRGRQSEIHDSIFSANGLHNVRNMWADGMTILDVEGLSVKGNAFHNNTDIDLIFGGCKNCIISQNSFKHDDDLAVGAFAALMLQAWPQNTQGKGGTSGDYSQAVISENTIDCGITFNCGFGLYIGGDAWYLGTDVRGGEYRDNQIKGAGVGINVDHGRDFTLRNNLVENFASTIVTSRGERRGSAVNISPDSRQFGAEALAFTRENWDGSIPNWPRL